MIAMNSLETLLSYCVYLRVVSPRGDETSVQYVLAQLALKWRMVGVRMQRMGDGRGVGAVRTWASILQALTMETEVGAGGAKQICW